MSQRGDTDQDGISGFLPGDVLKELKRGLRLVSMILLVSKILCLSFKKDGTYFYASVGCYIGLSVFRPGILN